MQPLVAEVSALLLRGRGWWRRLAVLPGLVEATVAIPGEAEPATNGRLIQRWCGYQPKHDSHSGYQQQSSWHGRPLLLQGRDQAGVSIGVPGAATARID